MAIYMKFGDIDGPVTTKGYEKWIELDSFQQSIQRDTKNPTGSGGSASARESSTPRISEINITKAFDKSSTKIIQHAVAGAFDPTTKIVWTTTSKSATDTFLTITLRECGITSYDMESKGGDGIDARQTSPLESITLNFTEIEWRATPLNNKGQPEVEGAVAYNLRTLTSL